MAIGIKTGGRTAGTKKDNQRDTNYIKGSYK